MTRNRAVQHCTAGTDDTAANQMSGDTIRASHSTSPHSGLEEMFPGQGNITGDREDGPSGLPSNESSEPTIRDRKSTRLNSSHSSPSRMPSSA